LTIALRRHRGYLDGQPNPFCIRATKTPPTTTGWDPEEEWPR
jgi:hypothetical protein